MLPDVGNSLWNSSLKGVLDQGVDGYSFTWTYPQAHLVLSSDNQVAKKPFVCARATAMLQAQGLAPLQFL